MPLRRHLIAALTARGLTANIPTLVMAAPVTALALRLTNGGRLPLHPGAERFYKEAGKLQ